MPGHQADNTYPGAGCDVRSALYSFSFEPRPRWSRAFPLQREILEYLRECADRHGLAPHVRLGTEITAARYDRDAHRWRLRTAAGAEYTARVVVSAVGRLNRPKYPGLPGRDEFTGTAFHAASGSR